VNLRYILLMHPPPAPICWDDPTGTSSLEPTMVQLQTLRLLHAALDGSNDCSKGLQLLQVEPRGNGNCIGDPQETGAHLKWPRRFLKTIATMVTLFERLFPVHFLMGLCPGVGWHVLLITWLTLQAVCLWLGGPIQALIHHHLAHRGTQPAECPWNSQSRGDEPPSTDQLWPREAIEIMKDMVEVFLVFPTLIPWPKTPEI